MSKGGYQILDFKNADIRSGITNYIPNAYETLEATRKPILLTNLMLDGLERRDAFVDFYVAQGNFNCDRQNFVIQIGKSNDGNDPVTIIYKE